MNQWLNFNFLGTISYIILVIYDALHSFEASIVNCRFPLTKEVEY